MSDRRGFLRGLVTLPLVGGGVTLIGRPAAAVPLIQAVAAPDLMTDPRQRARYAWEAFAAAMRDVTAGADGWYISGGQTVRTVGYMKAGPSWTAARAVHHLPMVPDDPNCRGLVDQHEELEL